ncbi:polysaccharide biosynthesis/export family protein [Hirschia baltica]|uniref:Polysaccharide export protein n=1 Tax=Hirschia baltica (strain ATCC 49814 / DSM 5838 / IFAM 1418) TaxID=582402 RepID=C6XKT6_HIRBI|nr:polysaccharide biosynthesis/export family protein [Hirschia baltica]ACT59653.1 polysaccharide export protein [Hirschia baltica ATCC 49814]
MMKNNASILALAVLSISACSSPQPGPSAPTFQSTTFSKWSQNDAAYRFYPGDKLNITFRQAPELDREVVIAPDGRISLPLMDPVVVADLSAFELQKILERIYARELVDPSLTVTPVEFASQQIFVGGEVNNPGVFPLPGQIDPLQAIVLAGGWNDNSKPEQVIILRRDRNGQIMTRVVDVKNALRDPSNLDIGPLKRFDVVFVSRSRIANENKFIQQYVLSALPIDFSFFYNLKDNAF